jgi:putrescine aminotransferase
MKFITLEEAQNLDIKKVAKLYKNYYNPALYKMLKYTGLDIQFVRASDIYVYDKNGNGYLDFIAGFGALNIGHNNKKVIDAVNKCSEKPNLLEQNINLYNGVLANNISYLTQRMLSVCHFTNCGTETVEEAIKLAMLYNPEGLIIYCSKAYHGKTLGAISALGDNVTKQKYNILRKGFIEVPFGDFNAIRQVVNKFKIVAILLEPIQGEGGINVPPIEYLKNIRKLCDKEDIIFILDEIQTGLGRCGSMFCYEQFEAVPDILCLSKSLSGGIIPIGCIAVEESLWHSTYGKFKNATLLSTTFGGNTLACAAAIKTLEIIVEETLPEKAKESGLYAIKKLQQLKNKYPIITDVRGKGLMIGIEFKSLNLVKSKTAIELMITSIISKMLKEYKIICGFTINNPTVLRFEPPLTIEKQHIDYFVNSLDAVLSEQSTILNIGVCTTKNLVNNIFS